MLCWQCDNISSVYFATPVLHRQARLGMTEVEVLLIEHLLALTFGLNLELASVNNRRVLSGKVGARLVFQCNRTQVLNT